MKIWCVCREYANVSESGGVKLVTRALCENFAKLGHKVTVIMPLYACTNLEECLDYEKDYISAINITVATTKCTVHFDKTHINDIRCIFVRHEAFSHKKAVYTYTQLDEEENPAHKKGKGHEDAKFMDVLFQKSVATLCSKQSPWLFPDIVHCHDATCAMIKAFMQQITQKLPQFIVTIHNAGLGYHHEFSSIQEAEFFTGFETEFLQKCVSNNCVEPFLIATETKCTMTTVSTKYAIELKDTSNDNITGGLASQFKRRGVLIIGIENGIDTQRYDTKNQKCSLLPFEYDCTKKDFSGKLKCREYLLQWLLEDIRQNDLNLYGTLLPGVADCVYFCFHARLVEQKGISILCEAVREFFSSNDNARFIIMGQGESELESKCKALANDFRGKVVYFCGYDKAMSRLCIAAADFLLLPSIFEPCGTEDLIASVLGTIPVANYTGGLAKIVEGETGFLYSPNTKETLAKTLLTLCNTIAQNKKAFYNIMQTACCNANDNFSWEIITKDKWQPLLKSVKKH